MTQTTHITAGLEAHLQIGQTLPTRYISADEMAYHRHHAQALRAQAVSKLVRAAGRGLLALWNAPSVLPNHRIGDKLLVTAE